MTVIAGFTMGSRPVLVGSVLVAPASAVNVSSRTSGTRLHAFAPEQYDADLVIRQRVTLVNDHLAIAWSGPLSAAAFVLRQLRGLATGRPIPQKLLDSFLKEVQQDRLLSQLALVGIRIDESGAAHLFGRGVKQGFIGERGTQYFCEAAAHDTFCATMAGSIEVFNNDNSLVRGICAANALANVLLAYDVDVEQQIQDRKPHPMLALYGGGYETVVLNAGRLTKVACSFSFWRVQLDAQQARIETPTLMIKRDYAGRTLLLRWSWTTKHGRGIVLPMQEQQCLAIVGAEDTAVPLQAEPNHWPSFRSDFECHAILARNSHGIGGMGTLTHSCSSDLTRDIRFSEHPEQALTRARLAMNAPTRIRDAVLQLGNRAG